MQQISDRDLFLSPAETKMMNTWVYIFSAILVASFVIETFVSILNLQAITPCLPDEFKDIYDDQKYQDSQSYTRTREKFAIISNGYSTFLTLLFLVLGGFNWLDLQIRGLGYGELLSGLIFLTGLAVLSFVVHLPFSIYSTFVIEEKFGFNKTSVSTFLFDLLKATFLSILLGLPLLAALLWLLMSTTVTGWLYCWGLIVIFMIVMHFLSPTLIMPLFNKFTPLDNGELKIQIESYADQEHFAIQGIYTMDGSKRSTKLNAFFTGLGKFKKIVFFDTLLEKLSNEQIISVLAHEMGHFKLNHIQKLIFFSILQTGLMMFLLGQFLKYPEISSALGMSQPSTYTGLLFLGLLFSPVSMVISTLLNAFSRKFEFAADDYAAASTANPEHLIAALKELSKANLSNLTPHPLNVFLNYSHPPVLKRIKKLQSVERG